MLDQLVSWDFGPRMQAVFLYIYIVGAGRNGKNTQTMKNENINSKGQICLPCQRLDFGKWVPSVLSHLRKQRNQNILVVDSGFDGDLCF